MIENPTSPLGWGGLGLRLCPESSSNWKDLPFPTPSLDCILEDRGSPSTLFSVLVLGPLFSPLGTPKNRYHRLSWLQNDSILDSQMGSKTGSGFRPGFLFPLSRFSAFLHATSSASRIAPAISKPHFPLSSFLLFLLSLWSAFGWLLVTKWVPKQKLKLNPKLDPSKNNVSPNIKILCSKEGVEMVPQKKRHSLPPSSSLLARFFF